MRLSAFLVLWCGLAVAAPPVVQPELKADVGRPTLLTVKVEAGKRLGTEKTFDPSALMLARLWSDDPNTYEFWVFPNAEGTFYVPFWTEGEAKGAVCKIVAGKGVPPPDKPTDPVVPPTGKKHFMLVRPGGVGIPKVIEDAMNLPAWSEVKAAGHSYADLPFNDLPESARAQFAGQPLPFLLTWEVSGNTIKLPPGAKAQPAPLTNDAVRGLLK